MTSYWSRRSAVLPLAFAFLAVIAASAQACLTLPASSTWEGRSRDQFNYQATWRATVTTTETSPGVWSSEGNGEIILPFYGAAPGHLEGTLTCTGPTTDSVGGRWTDNFGDNVTTVGSLTIGSNLAVESGTWQGATIREPPRTTVNGKANFTRPTSRADRSRGRWKSKAPQAR